MADTRIQHEAEAWVIEHGLQSVFPGTSFRGAKLPLTWGGLFNFDAVSSDGEIVCAISTSAAKTATGKSASAKYQKLKTDALYLLNLKVEARRVMIFTELSMYEYFQKERLTGRFPSNIELLHTALPDELHARVLVVRELASKETSPAKA